MSDWARVKEVFAAVVDLPEAERPAFLNATCRGDPTLKEKVEELLESDQQSSDFLENPPTVAHELALGAQPEATIQQMAEPHSPATESDNRSVGPYTLREKLGEGGMGVVYAADQVSPIRRRVALKLIKRGMDTDEILRRFEAEKQALSLMDHPNIARVLDAGASDDGRPYFVMEYVSGVPITRYCDQQRLDLQARLRLFVDCCNAIQHAHQKGIIHRDIKPSNVLVMILDDWPTVKVIDFGVAKAVDHRLNERTLYTEQGVLIGTPEYMSPEQAEMTALNVDTRTDIYSLGVLLYELLSGTLPFDPISLRGSGIAEIQRKIRELEPPVPSARLSRLVAAPELSADGRPKALGRRPGHALSIDEIAWCRQMTADALRRTLRGDLDWIAMKAMDKDRTRRYSTAAGLALDIERFLRGEPVEAGPPGTTYRFRKFVRRNRSAVAAAALVALSMVVGIVGTTWGMLAARANADRAMELKRKADVAYRNELEARKTAQSEMVRAQFVAHAAREDAAYVSRRLAELLPLVRRGVDLAGAAPEPLKREYPEELMPDTGTFLAGLLPDLIGDSRDEELVAALQACARCDATPEDEQRAIEWTTANAEHIQLLIDTSQNFRFQSQPEFGTGEAEVWQAIVPETEQLNAASIALGAAAAARHALGDARGAIACLAARRRVAIDTGYGGMMISIMAEYSWREAVYRRYRLLLSDLAVAGEIPGEFRDFLQTDRPIPSITLTGIPEALSIHRLITGLFVKTAADEPPHVDRSALARVFEHSAPVRRAASRDEMLTADYAATLEALDAADKMTELLRRAVPGPVDEEQYQPLFDRFVDNPLTMAWIAGPDRIMRAHLGLMMERDASIITLALAEYRAKHNCWPATTEEALTEAALQPLYREYIGAKFIYKLTDGRPLLYHGGFDGKDDNGLRPTTSLGQRTPGTDIVFLGNEHPPQSAKGQ